jgi:hypothetical protein
MLFLIISMEVVMNKKTTIGFGMVAGIAIIGLWVAVIPDNNLYELNQTEKPEQIETITPQAGDVEGPHEMVSTDTYPQSAIVVGPFADASVCQEYMNQHVRSVQAGIDNPAIASNPVQLVVAAEAAEVQPTTRQMFICQRILGR